MAYIRDISNFADILDIRDLIERIETLREERNDFEHDDDGNLTGSSWAESEPADADELEALESFVEGFRGYGGDHEWDGSWFPVTFIRDSYFVEAMEEQVKDMGYINTDRDNQIPSWIVIDWEKTAENMQMDYTSGEFDGVTYWAR